MSAGQTESHKAGKENALAVEVVILTTDHEIHGLIYVSRNAREDRRISDLLNNPNRRFLAVTDAKLINRHGPSTPRLYSFLQLHIDNIIMIHPTTQAVMRHGLDSVKEEVARFDDLRAKFKRIATN
ncbi:MAG TPA: hypothetical protein V6C99_10460 [Oculatellaceae cyanobacterium]|jgi:hypothetical protein